MAGVADLFLEVDVDDELFSLEEDAEDELFSLEEGEAYPPSLSHGLSLSLFPAHAPCPDFGYQRKVASKHVDGTDERAH